MAADRAELRGLVSADLAQALDAIAMARNMDRHAYVVQVLSVEVRRVLHEANVLQRTLRGNPLMSDAAGAPSRDSGMGFATIREGCE